jgi:hypothetical protein
MKNYKNIEVAQKKRKINGTFKWILTYTLDNQTLGETIHSVKQNRMEQIAFNFCMANGLTNLTHPSTF